MGESKELKKIKRIYGEKFKNLCRELFPVIIEQEGKLLEILEKRFSHNCDSLYEVITQNRLVEDFKELVFSEFDPTREEENEEEKRTPYEILEEEGYDLIECKSEEDIQGFRKYYAPNEVLCTIYNGGRLATRDCFFAVRKDVDKIRREDFKNPDKSDEYSTSVLGIQFTRNSRKSMVQIISRYNHTVSNPNCTLGNDLDKLAPGLSQSFVNLLKERGIALTTENKEGFEMPGYTLASDGRYYKYNMEINGEYFCPGNIVISNGEARSIGDPEKGLLIDHFYINFQNKRIKDMRRNIAQKDVFVDAFEHIEKIEVERTESANKKIKVYIPNREKPIEIEVDRDNQIIGYINHDVKYMGNCFLWYNRKLRKIEIPKLEEVGDGFLSRNRELKQIKVPSLRRVGYEFLYENEKLEEIEIPNLQEAGDIFLCENIELKQIKAPNLRRVGRYFLHENEKLEEIEIPNLEEVGDGFLSRNGGLRQIKAPSLRSVGDGFLSRNGELRQIKAPSLRSAGNSFLSNTKKLEEIEIPNLEEVGDGFLSRNRELRQIKAPSLRRIGASFLIENEKLKEIEIPSLEEVGDRFLGSNRELKQIKAPSLRRIGRTFLIENEKLEEIEIPNLEEVGNYFLYSNRELKQIKAPNLRRAGRSFLGKNEKLGEIEILNLEEVGANFLQGNRELRKIKAPSLRRAGRSFLECNEKIEKVSIPNLPEIEKELREKAEKNIAKKEALISDIAQKREKIKEQEEEIERMKLERNSQNLEVQH